MAATLRDVAIRAGVSPSTVSRVVRDLPVVSEDLRERVFNAIAAVGYRPDASARSMRTGTSHAVGFVVPDISNWFYSMVFRGAQDVLYDAGYDLLLTTSNGDIKRERHAVDSLLSRRVDALILSLTDEQATLLRHAISDLPVVLVDRECDGIPADTVLSDHASGMEAAVHHLAELGHTRMALFTGTPNLYTTRSRRASFFKAVREVGLRESDQFDIAGDRSVESGERNTLRLMQAEERPTAIIAGSNQLLHGTLKTLHGLGLACPRDVSLVACEDSDIAQLHWPPISAVSRDLASLGKTAAKLVLGRLGKNDGDAGGPDHIRTVRPTTFVNRGSTGKPPSA